MERSAEPPQAPTQAFPNKRETAEVLYLGRTWAVTSYGIERHNGPSYDIDKSRLLEVGDFGEPDAVLFWPLQLADKPMKSDYPDFAHCFVKAFELHSVEVDAALLQKSLEKGLAIYLKRLGTSLREVHREPLNRPLIEQFANPHMGQLRNASVLGNPAARADSADWRVGWGEPDPSLLLSLERDRQRQAT